MRALVLLLLSTTAVAAPEEKKWRRELNGHVFVPSLAAVPDPFLSTHLMLTLDAGYSWIKGPSFDLRGNPIGGATYRAEAMGMTALFQAALTRWLALRIGGGGGVNGGEDARSALVVGMQEPLSVNVGLSASWQLGRLVRFGPMVDFYYTHNKLVQPLVAVRNSLSANQADAVGASQTVHSYTLLPGVALAVAPHPAVGLLASAQFIWNGLDNGTPFVNLGYFALGLSAQLDLRAFSPKAALGFLLSYRTQIPFESWARFTHTLEWGIFYTGRREIDFGLELQVRWFDLRPDTRVPLDTTQLISILFLRYHWN
jgi:hypothetical protein